MSRKFLTPLDLAKNELQNARIQNLATAPSSPVVGQIYYDTTLNGLYIYNGTAWALAGGITAGTLASRPLATAVAAGTFYYATDNYLVYYSNGTTWQQTHAFGSGASTTVSIAGSAADGTSTNYARADHSHAGPGFGPVTTVQVFNAAGTNGVSTTVSRSDHSHGTPSIGGVTPTNITATSAAVGSGTTAAVDNHVHGFTPGNFAISAFGAAAADVSHGGYKITNLGTPTATTDAANKQYVDNAVSGLSWKQAVNLRASSNIGLAGSSGTLVIDGHTALTSTHNGYRLLLNGQTTSSDNGIYVYSDSGSGYTLNRATDADSYTELIGAAVFVEEGTSYGATAWLQSNHYLTSFSGQTWVQFSGSGVYTASNGVNLVGNNFSFLPTGTGGLQTSSGGASIKLPSNSGLNTDSTGTYVGAGTGISVLLGNVSIDTSVVARKYAANVGDNSSTSITITHNLGTRDVQVTLYDASSYAEVMCDVTHATTNTITLAFSTAPTTNQYRVVVIG
jgi:hypothetical protein